MRSGLRDVETFGSISCNRVMPRHRCLHLPVCPHLHQDPVPLQERHGCAFSLTSTQYRYEVGMRLVRSPCVWCWGISDVGLGYAAGTLSGRHALPSGCTAVTRGSVPLVVRHLGCSALSAATAP